MSDTGFIRSNIAEPHIKPDFFFLMTNYLFIVVTQIRAIKNNENFKETA